MLSYKKFYKRVVTNRSDGRLSASGTLLPEAASSCAVGDYLWSFAELERFILHLLTGDKLPVPRMEFDEPGSTGLAFSRLVVGTLDDGTPIIGLEYMSQLDLPPVKKGNQITEFWSADGRQRLHILNTTMLGFNHLNQYIVVRGLLAILFRNESPYGDPIAGDLAVFLRLRDLALHWTLITDEYIQSYHLALPPEAGQWAEAQLMIASSDNTAVYRLSNFQPLGGSGQPQRYLRALYPFAWEGEAVRSTDPTFDRPAGRLSVQRIVLTNPLAPVEFLWCRILTIYSLCEGPGLISLAFKPCDTDQTPDESIVATFDCDEFLSNGISSQKSFAFVFHRRGLECIYRPFGPRPVVHSFAGGALLEPTRLSHGYALMTHNDSGARYFYKLEPR